MIQKSAGGRGRPRAYDPDTALAQAMSAFWIAGYSATSLDDLSAATGMNRPSLYAAFGDKKKLYRTLLERYRVMARDAMKTALAPDIPLREGLLRVYRRALSLYLAGEKNARGCFLIGTAVTEAALDREVRACLDDGLREIEQAFEVRFRTAQRNGELPHRFRAAALARLSAATLYSLAIHSRIGAARAELQTLAKESVDLICGMAKSATPRGSALRRRTE